MPFRVDFGQPQQPAPRAEYPKGTQLIAVQIEFPLQTLNQLGEIAAAKGITNEEVIVEAIRLFAEHYHRSDQH